MKIPESRSRLPFFLLSLLNAVAWILAALITLIISTFSLLIVLPCSWIMDRDRRVLHLMSRLWGGCLIAAHPLWSLHTKGLHHFDRRQHYVIVANHQSILDILVVLTGLPLQFKFIAKKELFTIPCMGWHMWAADYIALDRGNPRSSREAVAKAHRWLDRKISILLFPEGTRSEDGEIHAFKNGAFKMAIEKRVPILPVVIDGTWAVSPKKSRTVSAWADFQMEVCDPVAVSETDTVDVLKDKIRSSMAAKLAEMRR